MERYRISDDVAIYFVTMTVVEWLPVFVSEATCRIIAESLNFCHVRKGLRIHAYVIMPTHLHAILFFERLDPLALKATLTDFRKFTGRKESGVIGRRFDRDQMSRNTHGPSTMKTGTKTSDSHGRHARMRMIAPPLY